MDDHGKHAELDGRFITAPADGGADARLRDRDEPFGVPSRFGIGTLLVVTTAYGVFLTLLLALGADRRAIAWMLIFLSLIGAGQMLLFDSRRPRLASFLAGAMAFPAIDIVASLAHGARHAPSLCELVSAIMLGAPAGYLAGGVVAGVFLIMDAVNRGLNRLRR